MRHQLTPSRRPSRATTYRQLLQFAAPIIALQLLSVLASFVDSAMLARLGNHALAANALGYRAYLLVLVLGGGLFMACGVRMAEQRTTGRLNQTTCHALWLAAGMGCLGWLGLSVVAPWLFQHSAQPPLARQQAIPYLHWLGLAGLLFLVSGVLRQHCLVRAKSWAILVLAVIYSASHCLLSYLLILGHGPITSPLGAKGAGISECLSLAITLIVTLLFCAPPSRLNDWRHLHWLPQWRAIINLLAFSWPVAFLLWGEMAAVMQMVLWLGHFGPSALAAYQMVAELGMIALMLPYGLEMATGVLVAQSYAQQQAWQVQQQRRCSWELACMMMLPLSCGFVFCGPWLFQHVFHYNAENHPQVLSLAYRMLAITATYQVVDAARKSLLGALRGVGDVLVPMGLSLTAFWLVGCPVAYINLRFTHLGPLGIWLGMLMAMLSAAILIMARSMSLFNRPLHARGPLANTDTPCA